MKRLLITFSFLLAISGAAIAQDAATTFTNPLLPRGADPWVTYQNGYYYYTSTGGARLSIWKTKTMPALSTAEHKVIWTPPAGTNYSKELWAPELHFLQGKWYMYFAADDGKNINHRMYVLENPSADPMQGDWEFKGQVTDPTQKWAIDGSVFEHKKQLYFIWSGWEGDKNGRQDIYIAKMKNPYTIDGERAKVSSPEYDWETVGGVKDPDTKGPHVDVNEGPEILKHGNKLFLVYSASGCWTDHYTLGALVADASANLMDPKSWKKLPKPLFSTSTENSVYAPGHNSFFKSPDGKEDWILYHANPSPGCGCGGQRSPRMQKITWKKDGTPDFGIPVKTGEVLAVPK